MKAILIKEKQRNKRIRERVVDMYREFVSEVDPKNVFDLLIEKRVISIHQKQAIANKATIIDRCRTLLDHLFCCSNDESFIILREALEDQYHWIVERIDHCETENETESILHAKCNQFKMTKTEQQEHSENPANVNFQFDVEERLKKVLDSMKSNFEIGSKNLEEKLEESRKDNVKIKEQYEESRKETAEMKKQYEESRKETAEIKEQYAKISKDIVKIKEQYEERITDIVKMKEQYDECRKEIAKMKDQYRHLLKDFDKTLLRAWNLKNELDEIKSWAKSNIVDKRIFGNAQESINSSGKSNEPQQNPLASSSESTKESKRCAAFIVNCEAVIRLSLNRPGDVTVIEPLPDKFQIGAAEAATGYLNSIFVCGLGSKNKGIWRLDLTSSKWSKCASLIQGRQYHSVAFVDQVLYICGGWLNSSRKALDDVEAYDTLCDQCSKVGKLAYAVHCSGNCVPCKASLYIFGGYDAHNKNVSNVQVYDTKLNTCTLLTKQMPRACAWLRGELWDNTFILLGKDGFFVYDIDTQTWKMGEKFKLQHVSSGVIVNDNKLFVIGCGANSDYVRWIPIPNILNDELIEWKHYAKLPNNYFRKTFAFAKLEYLV